MIKKQELHELKTDDEATEDAPDGKFDIYIRYILHYSACFNSGYSFTLENF